MHLQSIQNKIYDVRDQSVMLDYDLAELFDVETKRLNEAVKRNSDRFPVRFMFRLSVKEWDEMRSQFATASQSKRNSGITPYAFTEHGVTMLASILRSKKAVHMNIAIVEAFISLKKAVLDYQELSGKVRDLENKYHRDFKDISEAINYLLQKDKQKIEQKTRRPIGFRKDEPN